MTKNDLGLREKFLALETELNGEIFERQDEIHSALLALISHSHHFQYGTPGVGKSFLVDRLVPRIEGLEGDAYFKWLLTKFSTPEELFGGPNLKLFKEEGIYKRITDKKLPVATVAFLDEALDLNTPIITPNGWTTVGGLEVGDLVYGADGLPVVVSHLTPIKDDQPCYEVIFSDGQSIVADGGHNWNIRKSSSHAWQTLTTEQIFNWLQDEDGVFFQTPTNDPVQLPEQDLAIDPYVLGLWLGNGNVFNGELYIRDEWVDQTLKLIQERYPEASIRAKTSEHLYAVSMGHTGFRTLLNQGGLINNKFIPDEYLLGSTEQRLELLRGLCDTDGYLEPQSHCVTFSNTNENIIDGFIQILHSFGIHATKRPTTDKRISPLTGNGYKQCWRVSFRPTPEMDCFPGRGLVINPRVQTTFTKIVDILPVEPRPVRCITVENEDHLFLVGKNMVVTHNCFKANSAILNALLKILNEREFDNCNEDPHIPLITMFGASNEIPSSKELEALSDRLHLWHHVKPMQEPSNFVKMLQLELDPNPPKILSLEDLEEAHGAASEVAVQDHIYEIFVDLQAELRTADILVTDRRFHQSIEVIKAEAWLNNHETTEVFDMKPLMHMLWKDPAHIDTVRSIVLGLVDPLEKQIMDLSDNYRKAIAEWERSLLDSDTAPMRTEATMQMYDKFTKAKKELAEYKESEKSTGRYCRSLHEFEGYLKSTALQIRTELGIDD